MLEERRAKVVRLLQQGSTNTDIANEIGVTERAVRNWRRIWLVYGDCVAPKTVVQGRPRLLIIAQFEVGVARPVSEVS